MGTYLINFIVYTMAMVGLLFIGVMVYKKTMTGADTAQNPKGLKIDNALRLSPRKTLYVVNAGYERFLIAADLDRTTFLARLDNNNTALENIATIDVEPAAGSFKESIKTRLTWLIPQEIGSGFKLTAITLDLALLFKGCGIAILP